MRKLPLIALALLAAVPAQAAGPSFSCARATGADERAICRSPTLSAQDRQLARVYNDVQHCTAMGGRGANIDDQRDWLQARRRCGGDRACLSNLYRVRINQFAPMAVKARRYLKAGDCPRPL